MMTLALARSLARTAPRLAAAALLTLPLVACAETRTIREEGFPAFEEVLGPTSRFTRADEHQVEGRDLIGDDTVNGTHKIFMAISPLGTEDEVMLEVRAIAKPESVSPVAAIIVSAHPMKFASVMKYRRDGVLPEADKTLSVQSQTTPDEEGVVKLLFRMPRALIPPGTERLAMPILVRYADGSAYVRFYETAIPAPVPIFQRPEEGAPPAAADNPSSPPGSAPPEATPPSGNGGGVSNPPPASGGGGASTAPPG